MNPFSANRASRALGALAIAAVCLATVATRSQPAKLLLSSGEKLSATNQSLVTAADWSEQDLVAKLSDVRAKLAEATAGGGTNVPAGITTQEIWTRRAALHRLALLYEQLLGSTSALQSAKDATEEQAKEAQTWTRFPEPPPYSLLLTDRLREEIQAERKKLSSNEAAGDALRKLIEDNHELVAQGEESLRKLNEQLEQVKEPGEAARLTWLRDLETLRCQVAAASVIAFEQQRSLGAEKTAESKLRLALLQRQLVFADAGAVFTREDLEKATGQIDRRAEAFERELDESQGRQLRARQALVTAQESLRQAQTSSVPATVLTLARESVATRESQLQAIDTCVYVLRALVEGCSVERTMWEFRFASFKTQRLETLRESQRKLAIFTRRLGLWRESANQQASAVSGEIQLQGARMNELAADSDLLPLIRERLQSLREKEAVLIRFTRELGHLQLLTERWSESLLDAEHGLPWTDRLKGLFYGTRSFAEQLWAFEVFTAQDTITVDGQKITGKRSVTIGKIVKAMLILVAGYWLTGLLTRLLERITVKRFKIEANQANLIRRWLRAFLLVCLVLLSLVSVKIPLTVFAFAGGALAIGLGFGTQNVLKNFVSGLILLFERPFRVGDVLDVGGQKGIVTSVGLRASVLQLWDGTETLIPNSSLLENNVTNWTYSNPRVRFSVQVGVAYGSDPRQVIKLMEESAERHGLVEKSPAPMVLFTEFGDSTLNFELRFWLDVGRANAGQVCSDLRLMIAGAFAEQGISIAFPQRDVHLTAPLPIDVRMVAGEPPNRAANAVPAAPGTETRKMP